MRQQIDQLRRQDLTPQQGDTKSDVSAAGELQKLAILLQDGHITAEEFETLKQQVIQKDSTSDPSPPPANMADDQNEMTPPEAQSGRLAPQDQAFRQTDDKKGMKPLEVLGGCLILIIAAILIGGVCVVVFSTPDEDTAETPPTATPPRTVESTPTATPNSVQETATARLLATSTPIHTPVRPTGLGISSTAIVNRFLELGDFDIERDGTVASIYNYDGTFQVGLFGPQNNISEASAIVRVTGETSLFENSLLLVVLINEITSWEPNDALEWIADATERVAENPDQAVSKRYGGYLLELRLVALLGLIELEITR